MKFSDPFIHITSFFYLLLFLKFEIGSSFLPPVSTEYYINDLYTSNSPDFDSLAEQWIIEGEENPGGPKFYDCDNRLVLGGPGVLTDKGYMERTYWELPDHDLIYFSVGFIMIDQWQAADSFSIEIDGRTISTWALEDAQANHGNDICGNSHDELVSTIVGRAIHTNTDLTIRVSFAFADKATTSLGIRNIAISLVNNTEKYEETSLVLIRDSSIKGGITCAANKFEDPNDPGDCDDCASECQSCFGPSESQCFRCKPGYSFIDNKCQQCAAGCLLCHGTQSNQCTMCQTGYFLHWDNTCKVSTPSSCPFPNTMQSTTGGIVKECYTKCMLDNYMLVDGNCVASCESPLLQRLDGRAKYCDLPCTPSAGQYIYWNGTCLNSCPHIESSLINIKLCRACDMGNYLYQDKTCLPTCPPSFFQKNESGALFCDYPCVNTTKYLFPNKSCLVDCAKPFNKRIEGDYRFCNLPCENPSNYFDIEDEICRSTCEYPYKVEDQVLCKVDMTEDEIKQAKLFAEISNYVNKVITVAGIVATFFGYHDPSPLCLVALVRMSSKIKYMTIKYSGKLQKMLIAFSVSSSTFPVFSSVLEKIKEASMKYTLPENFEQFKLHSSFLVNYWSSLMFLLLFAATIPFIYLVKLLTKKYPSWQKTIEKIKQPLKWNLLLMYFIADYDSIVLYTAFELQKPTPNSMMAIVSYLVCAVVNGVTVAILFRSLEIITRLKDALKHYSRVRRHRVMAEFKTKWGDYQIIYDVFKTDSFEKQAFVPIYILRILLFDIVIGYFYTKPLVQSITITVISVVMVLYIAIRSPFRRRRKQILHIVQEAIVLVMNVCVLTLAIFDATDSKAVSSRDTIGDVLIYIKLIFLHTSALVLIIQSIYYILQVYKNRNKTLLQIEKEVDKLEEAESDPIAAESNQKKASFMLNHSITGLNLLHSRNTSFVYDSSSMPQNTKNGRKEEEDWNSPEKKTEQLFTGPSTRKLSHILTQVDGSTSTEVITVSSNSEIRLRNGITTDSSISVESKLGNDDYQRWLKGGPTGLGMGSKEAVNYKSKFQIKEDSEIQMTRPRKLSTLKKDSNFARLPSKPQLEVNKEEENEEQNLEIGQINKDLTRKPRYLRRM